jgi:hypothetical protein
LAITASWFLSFIPDFKSAAVKDFASSCMFQISTPDTRWPSGLFSTSIIDSKPGEVVGDAAEIDLMVTPLPVASSYRFLLYLERIVGTRTPISKHSR